MQKLVFLVTLMLSSVSYAEEIPGQQLLSYFAAHCKTQGEWSRGALADSMALVESLKKLSDDPDCRTVAGAVAQLNLLNQQLAGLEQINETQSKIAELNSKEQELLIHLSTNADPLTVSEINKSLRELQVSRAGLVGRERSERELSGKDKASAMLGVIQIANATYGQITSNQSCLQKNPDVLKTATSVIAGVGAAAMVVNPALGLGITAGASLLGTTIEGVQQYTNARTIRNFADNTLAAEAYKCAMETMSERWCQMRDAEAFLIFKASQRAKPILNSNLGMAIRLNDREIPVLLEWLNKIRSGVAPTTTSDASRRSVVFSRETMVRSLEDYGIGLIEENRPIYLSYSDMEERWNFIRSLVSSLQPPASTGVKNPMLDVLAGGYGPYFLLGLPDDRSIRNELGYIAFETWEKPPGFNPTIDLVKERYLDWTARARARVNQELTQVLQPDTLQTLSSAYDRTGNRWKISPMDSMKNLITFLELNEPNEDDFAFKKLYENTLQKLKTIYDITETAVIREEMRDNRPVEEIYEITQLKYGTVVIQARLDMIVRLSLLELLEKTSTQDQVLVAQLLAAERFNETITKMSGTDNLAAIKADINRAQPITISNLNSFISVFGKNINRILGKVYNEEINSRGVVAKSKRYARTELCYLLMAVPDAEYYINLRLCEGLKFEAVMPNGPETDALTMDHFRRDLNDRACVYRDFLRRSKIFENWGVK